MKGVRKVVRFLVRLVVSCLVVGWIALWVVYWDAARGYDREMKRAEALGLSVRYTDMDPQPPVPDADNAGPLYRAAMAKVATLGDTRAGDAAIRAAVSREPEDWEPVRDAVAAWSPVLGDVEAAASKPRCHFERNWSEGSALAFPEFSDLRRFTEVLCARALLQARSNDSEAAFKSLRTAISVGRHAGEEPVFIAMLVGIGCETRAIRTINRMVDVLGPASLDEARSCLASIGPLPDLRDSMRGEVVFQFNAFDEVDQFGSMMVQDAPPPLLPYAWLVRPPFVNSTLVRRAYQTRHLRRWNDGFEAAGKQTDPRPLCKALDVAGQELEASLHPSDVLARIVFPVFSQAGNSILKLEAQERMLAASLDLRGRHARAGAYPESAPDLPLDPFDGKPLRYKREGEGFVLYSVGSDLKDNGGRDRVSMTAADQGVDEVFKVPG